MLQSIKNLINFNIEAKDGSLGRAYDYYFDDVQWKIRYLVVSTSRWLPGRKVLLSPEVMYGINGVDQYLVLDLTTDQIKESPDVGTELPVSKQKEQELRSYYSWPTYWNAEFEPRSVYYKADDDQSEQDHHLRSVREVKGYPLSASDGEIGHVDDLIVDFDDWTISYMVVQTGSWLESKKVLVPLEWIQRISWSERQVTADLTQEQVKHSPIYESYAPVNREYEIRLYDYYGRPCPWVEAEVSR